ncbi:LptA/OstA family protein [Candidatus Nucleicultrix amoebiphila]|jgi:lipopolysaccharide export system protein LptA|uniref:Organic solvent tolerance-like N-terminal domain-containing protein n=1 Tax=Candidatus Nucleicultrix amoebiphila FS5 TaxID=1414854 RepID=A0A1W6N3Y4_9PROT|nr:LptA/OstA family protein [Candidatus Nucleicultrix amoebiphila]ARN84597.1 hypothetical protein GQ61_03895 [Candidatus Nucleicultrix amoebiphila FS5]
MNKVSAFILLFLYSPLMAFTFDNQNNDLPIEIDAKKGIVCEQNENRCIAEGSVVVRQGERTLYADRLIAYLGPKEAQQKLSRIVAQGHVYYEAPALYQKAIAGSADYNLKDNTLTLSGGPLKVWLKDVDVTAQKVIRYDEKQKIILAEGDVVARQNDKSLLAPILKVHLKENKQGKTEIDKLEAEGVVKIITSKEIVQAKSGTYKQTPDEATLSGNVAIDRLDGRLEGDYVEIDVERGINRMTSKIKRAQALVRPSKETYSSMKKTTS